MGQKHVKMRKLGVARAGLRCIPPHRASGRPMSRLAAFAMSVALALLALPGAGSAAEAVTLQLSGPATFEFAGYYAALWQGYYRDAGLDVTIRPGGSRDNVPIDPVREVKGKRAQFGVGTTKLVLRRAEGLPVLLLSAVFTTGGAR